MLARYVALCGLCHHCGSCEVIWTFTSSLYIQYKYLLNYQAGYFSSSIISYTTHSFILPFLGSQNEKITISSWHETYQGLVGIASSAVPVRPTSSRSWLFLTRTGLTICRPEDDIGDGNDGFNENNLELLANYNFRTVLY